MAARVGKPGAGMKLSPGRMPQTTDAAMAALSVRSMIESAQRNAQRLDAAGKFPVEDIHCLRKAGLLQAVLPILLGGLGIGTEPAQATIAAEILQGLGEASIAIGRIYEGHLNAVRLVMRLANPAQRLAAALNVRAGQLHAVWVTDGAEPLRYCPTANGIELTGSKMPCSAAGFATRAVVTARGPDNATRLLIIPLDRGEVITSFDFALQGVRASATGRVDFPGIRHAEDTVFGLPDAYLNEPEFSTGAWRAAAIAAGAVSALVTAATAELVARGRADAAQQADRLGRMLIHAQSAKLWIAHAAPIAEEADADPAYAVATVQLARTAIETAGLVVIQLVQRSLGLSALSQSNPIERMCRDLATYLRQPAPDEAITLAAAYFAANPKRIGSSV